jgi:ADP-heptose:LPS heptosyltransferase
MPKLFAGKVKKRLRVPKEWTLRDFHENRNKILIIRQVGGLGDIVMHRMMFEDMKNLDPDIKIHFATLPQYFSILEDHPFIDKILDSRTVKLEDYLISYNTTCACTRYEMAVAPQSGLHRSDVWSQHCGVKLSNHNIHLNIDPEIKNRCKNIIKEIKGSHTGPTVMLCPISAMIVKNLTDWQQKGIVEYLRKKNCFVFATHTHPIPILDELNVPNLTMSIIELAGLIDASDYVISVDTSQFHIAGGLKKPLTGIFTFADGKVYGKYFDFQLIQKHRDDGWDCGPCYCWANCPKTNKIPKPCLTELSLEILTEGIHKMFKKWPYRTILKEKHA